MVRIRKSLSLNCRIFIIKTLYQFIKDFFEAPSINVINNPNNFHKNSVYPKTFYINKCLLLTSTSLQNLNCKDKPTRNHCRTRYTLNKKSYLHWQGISTYLYSQLTKLLLISHDMNYPRKNLIFFKQFYTFQSNQINFKNPKSSLPLERFISGFLTTLNLNKLKLR